MVNLYILKTAATAFHVDLVHVTAEGVVQFGDSRNPLYTNSTLRDELIERCAAQDVPLLQRDAHEALGKVLWGAFSCGGDGFVLVGPCTLTKLTPFQKRSFCEAYGVTEADAMEIPVVQIAQYLAWLRLLAFVLTGREFADNHLVFNNHLEQFDFPLMEEERTRVNVEKMDMAEEKPLHHTFQDEKRLSEAIGAGDIDRIYQQNQKLMMESGRLAKDDLTHWYNLSIVAITVSTRSAIENGAPPAKAYEISDFYINRLRLGEPVISLQNIVNNAVMELARLCQRERDAGQKANVVARCKAYISEHYRERLRIADVAEHLEVSEGHLSRTFKKEMGIPFQEYILQTRIERASHMLRYSDESIAYIGEYVGFGSQSYFTEQFKRRMGITPREYREKYKPAGF